MIFLAEMYSKIMEVKTQANSGERLDGLATMAQLKAKYAK